MNSGQGPLGESYRKRKKYAPKHDASVAHLGLELSDKRFKSLMKIAEGVVIKEKTNISRFFQN